MQNNLTPQEAITELSHCKINGYTPNDWDRRCKAVDAAKAALEKQIPKRPRQIAPRRPDGRISTGFICSKCAYEVMELFNDYCPACGQAQDWNTKTNQEEK